MNVIGHIRTLLVSGLFMLIPLAVTLFFLKAFFLALTFFVRPVMRFFLDELPEYILTVTAIIVTVLVLYLAGLITTRLIGLRLFRWGESLLLEVPIVKSIYSASKHVVEAFSSSAATPHNAVALIDFPRKGALATVFITGTILDTNGKRFYKVVVPSAPNPTAGFLLFLPADEVQLTDISVETGIKMIFSGGVLSPPSYQIIEPPFVTGTSGLFPTPKNASRSHTT